MIEYSRWDNLTLFKRKLHDAHCAALLQHTDLDVRRALNRLKRKKVYSFKHNQRDIERIYRCGCKAIGVTKRGKLYHTNSNTNLESLFRCNREFITKDVCIELIKLKILDRDLAYSMFVYYKYKHEMDDFFRDIKDGLDNFYDAGITITKGLLKAVERSYKKKHNKVIKSINKQLAGW